MTDLAAIVARDAAVTSRTLLDVQAFADRRTLLVLLRETRTAVSRYMVAAYRSETVGAEWVEEFDKRYTELQDSMAALSPLESP